MFSSDVSPPSASGSVVMKWGDLQDLTKSEHQTWLEAENITLFHVAIFFRDTLKTEFASLIYPQTDWLTDWLTDWSINSMLMRKNQNGKKWLSINTILNFIFADFQWRDWKQSLSDRSSLSSLHLLAAKEQHFFLSCVQVVTHSSAAKWGIPC